MVEAVRVDQRVTFGGVERQGNSYLEWSDQVGFGGGVGVDELGFVGFEAGFARSGQQVVVEMHDAVGVAVVPCAGQPEADMVDRRVCRSQPLATSR